MDIHHHCLVLLGGDGVGIGAEHPVSHPLHIQHHKIRIRKRKCTPQKVNHLYAPFNF
ncbi:hypothetical protein D3C81_2088310 [compost metagenome]